MYNPKYMTSDGSENDGTNKPFSSLDSAPNASENVGKYITIEGESGCYFSNGTDWEKKNNPAIWFADQVHLNYNGYKKIAGVIAYELNTIWQ